jgi:hypothetical protein
MNPKDLLNNVLSRDMDRRQFLKYIGLALLAFVGISRFMKALSDTDRTGGMLSQKSSSYGGNRQSTLPIKGRKN